MKASTLQEYAKRMKEENLCGQGDFISMKIGDEIYATKENVDFGEIKEEDIFRVTNEGGKYALIREIYAVREDIGAVCIAHPKWVCAVSKKGTTIPAVLDDMAQIVGPTCKTAKNEGSVARILRKRNSCLLYNDGCVTTGRTVDEAYTCALVLDKASRCFVAGAVLGGNKIIPYFEAKLMQIIYKKKYSKVNQQNLQDKEK